MNLIDKFNHWRRRRRWNKQYRKGRWESLKSDKEAHRYREIIRLFGEYGPTEPSILDLGCGDGVLNERMGKFPFSYFLGIDFSDVSIDKAKAKNLSKSDFRAEDIINFKPDRNFDIIIFNEAFYYIPEGERSAVLQRMLDHLSTNGILIVSIFREGVGCWEYFKENPKLQELDFETITTSVESTYWKIGCYKLT